MRGVRACALIALWLVDSFAAAADVVVIALKHRSAEQLIPVIRPLLAQGGTVTGMNDQLLLRSTKANLAEIRKVLVNLDTQPRRLLIYVRQSAEGVDGNAPTGVRSYATRGANDDQLTQQIQALDGSPAYLRLAQSVPVATQTVRQGIAGRSASNAVAYRDTESGFQVVPRIAGDLVYLDISPRLATQTDSLGGASMQSAATTASGHLGEWFRLGGSSRNEPRSDASVLLGAAGPRPDHRSIWVKVEEIK